MRFYTLIFTKLQIIFHGLMESICKFRNTFSLEIDQAVNALYFPKKYSVALTECNRPDKTFIF